jgi:hypothetical protein
MTQSTDGLATVLRVVAARHGNLRMSGNAEDVRNTTSTLKINIE